MITTDAEEILVFFRQTDFYSPEEYEEKCSALPFLVLNVFCFLLFNFEVRDSFTIIKIPDLLKIIPNPYVTQFNCFHYLWSFIILIICVLLLS